MVSHRQYEKFSDRLGPSGRVRLAAVRKPRPRSDRAAPCTRGLRVESRTLCARATAVDIAPLRGICPCSSCVCLCCVQIYVLTQFQSQSLNRYLTRTYNLSGAHAQDTRARTSAVGRTGTSANTIARVCVPARAPEHLCALCTVQLVAA